MYLHKSRQSSKVGLSFKTPSLTLVAVLSISYSIFLGDNHVSSVSGMEWLPGQVYLKHEFILYANSNIMSHTFLLVFRLVFCSSVRCEEVGQVSSKGKRPLNSVFFPLIQFPSILRLVFVKVLPLEAWLLGRIFMYNFANE